MKDVVFITGNQKKADYLAELLGFPIEHQKVDQDEIQSLDLREVVTHKLHQAYALMQRPVLVEDTSLEFTALGRLPGTFIKHFLEELGTQGVCDLLKGENRNAIIRCTFAYFDGKDEVFFERNTPGTISEHPAGSKGFGFDSLFIPEGYNVTRAELSPEDDRISYLRIKPIDAVREFLT
jgi:non-canonical purine NTP pyrophosphatase (RdgB/HAM1 family)